MTEPIVDVETARVITFVVIIDCMETGKFAPAVNAIQRLIDAGYTKRSVGEILAETCFRQELERWPKVDDYGCHFRATALLFANEVCSVNQINNAIIRALLERGRMQGCLEGELYDMLTELIGSSEGGCPGKTEELTRGITRDPDN
jgi:hypothetical protein